MPEKPAGQEASAAALKDDAEGKEKYSINKQSNQQRNRERDSETERKRNRSK